MAKFYNRSNIVVLTFREDNGYPVDQAEFLVRSLGRGRWLVKSEDGDAVQLRTAKLQRFFRPEVYEDGYHSSGEPIYAYEEVHVYKA